jgi:predicted nucleic acid-binding protein
MSAYIDTSILGAYYCPEQGSMAAEKALRECNDPVISSLNEIEFHSLVSKKVRLKELDTTRARKVLDLFENHIAEGFYRRLVITPEHYIHARSLIRTFTITLHTLDALHLAASMVEQLPLMTSDQILAAAAKKHKHKVIMLK